MIVDEFRRALVAYDEMLREGLRDPVDMLNTVDKKLADIANHIAVCHRCLAEERAQLRAAFWPGARARHAAEVDRAGDILNEVVELQGKFFEFRYLVLSDLVLFLRGPATTRGMEKARQIRLKSPMS